MLKYFVIKNFLAKEFCNIINFEASLEGPIKPLSLNDDSEDMLNVKYKSSRSNLEYIYLELSRDIGIINSECLERLEATMQVDFNSPMASLALPVFMYGEGGMIKGHRDSEKSGEYRGFQTYVAMVMLSQRGEHFDGGEFWMNFNSLSSDDGKRVEEKGERIYPLLDQGDLVIWDNLNSVHGCEMVRGKNAYRATCGWRSLVTQKSRYTLPDPHNDVEYAHQIAYPKNYSYANKFR